MPFRLRVETGQQAGRELALSQAEVRIGRGLENDLVLLDPGVSRRHARILEQEGAYLVQDVGSANGTEVNAEPLHHCRALCEGDRIQVGPVVFVFVAGAAPQPMEDGSTRLVAAQALRPAPSRMTPPAPPPATAAQPARGRRQLDATLAGPLWRAWEALERRRKAVAGGIALAVLLALAGTWMLLFQPPDEGAGNAGPEPSELTALPLRGSFGLGDGVTWARPDMKVFTFASTAPTRAVALLRYRASGISREEVSISINGAEQGWVPPDAGESAERELELVLPPAVLERDGRNQLIFDNARNPPGRDSWRIEGLRVEIIPVPELSAAELLASARESVAKARLYEQQRAVGSENLFRAWRNYRDAWVTLEALEERPELYRDVRYALGQVSAELDRQCARLLLELQQGVQYRDRRAARAAFEDVLRHFPTTEHRCHTLALEQRSQYAL